MNKQVVKEKLYKFAPITLCALNALTVLLFLFGFVSIFFEKINAITIFSHFANIGKVAPHAGAEYLSLFIASLLFVGLLVTMIVFLVRSVINLKYCLLTSVLDFKLEYVLKLRNIYVYSLFFCAIYVGFVSFLSASSISFLAVLVFVIGLLVLTELKFFLGYTEEEVVLSDLIKETAKQLLLNVVFFALCAFLLVPAFEMMIQGYRHISFLLPSQKAFSAFYTDSLIGGMLTGITCVAVYALSLTIFFISNRNNVYEGPLYRLKTKSSFIVFIVATVLLALTTLLTVLVGSSSLKLNFGEIFEVIRVTLLPALLLSIVGLVIYALDFKAIKDEE